MITDYTLRRTRRTRGVSLSIHPGGELVVSAHPWVPKRVVDAFIASKEPWILKNQSKLIHVTPPPSLIVRKQEYKLYKTAALKLVQERLTYYNRVYGFTYSKVSIRNTISRWGSCTRSGHLNFSYKLAIIPQVQADYVVVHELCHLGQLNHSQKFWDLVAITFPDYKKIRKALRNHV